MSIRNTFLSLIEARGRGVIGHSLEVCVWNVVVKTYTDKLICYGDYKVTSEKAVKHIFMSNNYSNDTDTAPVAGGSQPSLHIEKKIKF